MDQATVQLWYRATVVSYHSYIQLLDALELVGSIDVQ